MTLDLPTGKLTITEYATLKVSELREHGFRIESVDQIYMALGSKGYKHCLCLVVRLPGHEDVVVLLQGELFE